MSNFLGQILPANPPALAFETRMFALWAVLIALVIIVQLPGRTLIFLLRWVVVAAVSAVILFVVAVLLTATGGHENLLPAARKILLAIDGGNARMIFLLIVLPLLIGWVFGAPVVATRR